MKESPKEKKFMRQKVVKPPVDKRRVIRRFFILLLLAVIFGAVAAVSFAVSRPIAERFFGEEPTTATIPITIERDPEPASTTETEDSSEEPETEGIRLEDIRGEVEEIVGEAFEDFPWTPENIAGYQSALQKIGEEADKGIVTVSSIRQEVDWFDNPVESEGKYAGAIIAINPGEVTILTGAPVVAEADALTVTFDDGSTAPGELKERDTIGNMAVIRVRTADLSDTTLSWIQALELGNSYMTRAGDVVIAVGGPSGYVHSIGQGIISYVAKGVQVADGQTRVFYTNFGCSVDSGTFFLNLSGQLIGWATNRFRTEDTPGITMAASVSEYKGVLQKLTNGIEVPYFGVMGQDVSEAMQEQGVPKGVYITEAIAGSPAYEAGIQNGDILVKIQDEEIGSVRDLQNDIEERTTGETVAVMVRRRGIDEYREIEYEVTIGAR